MPTKSTEDVTQVTYHLKVKPQVQQVVYGGQVYGADAELEFPSDHDLLLAMRTLQNSTVVYDNSGHVVPRDEALASISEHLRRKDKARTTKPVASTSNGIVDPSTDKGDPGPGLTREQMVKLTDKDLKPPAEDANKATLQTFLNKFKLGRPALSATREDIRNGIVDYLRIINSTRAEEKERRAQSDLDAAKDNKKLFTVNTAVADAAETAAQEQAERAKALVNPEPPEEALAAPADAPPPVEEPPSDEGRGKHGKRGRGRGEDA